jgi:hypothetical protein
VCEKHDGLRHVPHFLLDEEWLVPLDEIGCVRCGDVAIIDDREAGRVEVEANGAHAPAGD